MKAVVIENFGGPEQMKMADTDIPEPTEHEVQIKVAYASVNPVDWKIREGLLESRLPHEFPIILGWDVAGTISKVGSRVTHLNVGDEVFAYTRRSFVKWGTFSEYVCFEANHVVKKPKKISLKEAAAIPLTALTAWQALVEEGKIKEGDNVLIHAGAGGVGGMAIQIAKLHGARVFTTARTAHHAYILKLGADVPIDYTKENFVEEIKKHVPNGVDFVLDCIGGETLKQSFSIVKPGGKLISIVKPIDPSESKRAGINGGYVFVRPEGRQLKHIAQLIDEGKLAPPFIQEYPLEKAKEAVEEVKKGHNQGKIVLRII